MERAMDTGLLQVLDPEKLRALEEWKLNSSITLTQVNGQRKYGGPPPGWRGPAPGQGCEVYISHIPRDVFEDCLIPLFQRVAPLYEFRLMMNFSGQNRGFAYAKYGDPASAAATIRYLNKYPLQKNICLTVRKSTEKRQLCLSDVPSGISSDELKMVLKVLSDGVESVTLKSTGPKGRSIAALVRFFSHYAAAMAKKTLGQAFKKHFGICISIQWMQCGFRSRQNESHEEIPSAKPPRFQITQPTRHKTPNPLPPLSSLPPQPTQLFSRAVGGPAPHVRNGMTSQTTKQSHLPSHRAVGLLKWLCENQGLGAPLYHVNYKHTSPEGFLHFSYRVTVPRIRVPFCGAVQILPGPSLSTMEDEVQQAVAEQVIEALYHMC